MRIAAIASLALLSLASSAPAADPLDEQLAELRKAVREDRVEVVRRALPFSAEEAAAFWPLYLEHQAALDEVRDERLQLVLDFVEQAPTMNDETARSMLLRALDVKRALVEVDRQWLEKMLEVLPARKVGRYFQVENKIDAMINAELAAVVPLAPPTAVAPAAPSPAPKP